MTLPQLKKRLLSYAALLAIPGLSQVWSDGVVLGTEECLPVGYWLEATSVGTGSRIYMCQVPTAALTRGSLQPAGGRQIQATSAPETLLSTRLSDSAGYSATSLKPLCLAKSLGQCRRVGSPLSPPHTAHQWSPHFSSPDWGDPGAER